GRRQKVNLTFSFQLPRPSSFFLPPSSRSARAALPAGGELAFELLGTLRAAPVLAAVLARGISPQERTDERARALVQRLVGDPHAASVHRQLAPAAREELAAHDGGDAVRFEEPPDEMRFRRMPGDVDLPHLKAEGERRKAQV